MLSASRALALAIAALAFAAILSPAAGAPQCCTGRIWTGCCNNNCCPSSNPKTGKSYHWGIAGQGLCGWAWEDHYEVCGSNCRCSTCGAGKYVSTQPSTFGDRKCTSCPSGKYSTSNNVNSCARWSTCGAGKYVTRQPTPSRNRLCGNCASGKYSAGSNPTVCCKNNHRYVRLGTQCDAAACSAGLEVSSSKTSCVDINECSRNTDKCSSSAQCVNLHSSYKCTCPVGFVFDRVSQLREMTASASNFVPNRACVKQPLTRVVETTSTEIRANMDFTSNRATSSFTSYKIEIFERDFTLTTSTLLDGFPTTVTKAGTYGNLPPGTPYRVRITPRRGSSEIISDRVDDAIETACGCEYTAFGSIEDSTGAPGDVQARQQDGRIYVQWVDKSLCEEAFVFSRIEAATATSAEKSIGFTDAYYYASSDACERQHSPESVFDDIAQSELPLGAQLQYCVQATATRGPGIQAYTSATGCATLKIQWEAKIRGSVKLPLEAGSLPVKRVEIDWTVGSLSGQTFTKADGSYEIHIISDQLSTTEQLVTIAAAKMSGSVSHKFLCDGFRPCASTTVAITHLNFNRQVDFIDDTAVPFSGAVRIAATEHPGGIYGCALVDAEVCLRDIASPDRNLVCKRTDAQGNYQLPAVVGLHVFVHINYKNASHSFGRQNSDTVPPSYESDLTLIDDNGVEVTRLTETFVISSDVPWTNVDFEDASSTNLLLRLGGGKCDRDIGDATFEVMIPGCLWKATFVITQAYDASTTSVPSQLLSVRLDTVMHKGQPQLHVPTYFDGLGTRTMRFNAEKLIGGTIADQLDPTYLQARTVRFEYHPAPTLSLSFQNALKSACQDADGQTPVVLKRDQRYVATVTVREEFGSNIGPCDWVEGNLDILNRLGESPAVVGELQARGVLSDIDAGLLGGCYTSACSLPITNYNVTLFDGTTTFGKAQVMFPFIAGEPNINPQSLSPASPFTKLFRASMATAPHAPSSAAAKVIVTGSKLVSDKFSVAFPRYLPLMVLHDPPGGLSYSSYSNVKARVDVQISEYKPFTGAYSKQTVGLHTSAEIAVGADIFGATTDSVVFKIESDVQSHSDTANLVAILDPEKNTDDTASFELTFSMQTSSDPYMAGPVSDSFLVPSLNVVFKETQVISYNVSACQAQSESRLEWGLTPGGKNQEVFAWLSQADIVEVEIPALKLLLADALSTPEGADKAVEVQKAIDQWQAVLDRNDQAQQAAANGTLSRVSGLGRGSGFGTALAPESLIAAAQNPDGAAASAHEQDELRGISAFKIAGGGGVLAYDYHKHDAKTFHRGTISSSESHEHVDLDYKIAVATVGLKSHLDVGDDEKVDEASMASRQRTLDTKQSFALGDPDRGDVFDVEVYLDPHYGSFLFHTVAGRSRCKHEPNTYAREQPGISVTGPLGPVPHNQPATFEVLLLNEANEAANFDYYIDERTNPDSLRLTLAGSAGTRLEFLSFPPGATRITMQVFRGPIAYKYAPVTIGFRSQCDTSSYNVAESEYAFATTTVQVEFIRPCSTVELAGAVAEDGTFFVNAETLNRAARPGELQVTARNPGTAERMWKEDDRLTSVALEYRRVGGGSAWQAALDVASQPIDVLQSESAFGFASPWWHAGRLPDGEYQLRYRTVCRASAGEVPPGTDGSASATVGGWVDRKAPALFGVPEPADLEYFPGDEVAFEFGEELLCSRPHRFQVRLQVAGELRPLDSGDLGVVCEGRRISIDLETGVSFSEVTGKQATLSVANVEDLAGNVAAGSVQLQFGFAEIDVLSATALASILLNSEGPPDVDVAGSTAFRRFAQAVTAEVAGALAVPASGLEVVAITRVPAGLEVQLRFSAHNGQSAATLVAQLFAYLSRSATTSVAATTTIEPIANSSTSAPGTMSSTARARRDVANASTIGTSSNASTATSTTTTAGGALSILGTAATLQPNQVPVFEPSDEDRSTAAAAGCPVPAASTSADGGPSTALLALGILNMLLLALVLMAVVVGFQRAERKRCVAPTVAKAAKPRVSTTAFGFQFGFPDDDDDRRGPVLSDTYMDMAP